MPYARYANGVKFCKVCHLWIYPIDLAKVTYRDAKGSLRHKECGMMIRNKRKQKHATRSKTYILKSFILQAHPKLVLDKMLKLVLIFAALMATVAAFLPQQQQQQGFLYASPTTTEEPAAAEETTPAPEEEPSSSTEEQQENEEQETESQDDTEVPPSPPEEEPPVAATEPAVEPEPPTAAPAIVEEEELPPPPPATITCPPGQFPAGDPPACVDCEGPCPEEPPPTEEGPDEDCLFNPSLPKCASDNGECPDGFFQNEDGNCVPDHPNGCPEGYHSHEDDETGQCIPNDVPCEPGYVIDPDFPTCSKLDSVCERYPDTEGCSTSEDDEEDDDDDDNDNDVTVVVNKIIRETNNNHNDGSGHHHESFPEIDIIGLSVKENGDSDVCLINIDDEHVQCQEFRMPDDRVNQDFWRIIETDHDKDYDDGNTGSDDIDSVIEDVKGQDFSELDDASNHDFDIDLAWIAINGQGDGFTCLTEDESGKGKSLCEPFQVAAEDVDGQITEGVEFDD
jgi:hypothetical protein